MALTQETGRGPGRVAVVTGASAGIGRATAAAFARRGWRVALLARGEAGLEACAREVAQAGGEALVIRTDMADPDAVAAAARRVAERWGAPAVWVNNAMATVFGPLERVSPKELERVTAVTYFGTVYGTLAALALMKEAGRGTIVQVGSALSYRAIPLQGPYCGAKFAVRGFTDALRAELLHERSPVRLTMVQLPGVNTPQFAWSRSLIGRAHRPVGEVFAPDAAAEAIYRAAQTAPRELWAGTPALLNILGTMIAPGLLDRLVAARAYADQIDESRSPEADILFAPADRDFGTEGPFPAQAAPAMPAVTGRQARLGLAALAGLGAAALLLMRRAADRAGNGTARPRLR